METLSRCRIVLVFFVCKSAVKVGQILVALPLSASPMKRSVRPLFSVLLLIAFAVTLTCRAVVRRVPQSERSSMAKLSAAADPVFNFNSTLLKLAAVELGEEKTKKEIELLLEGNFHSRVLYSLFSTWRRFNRVADGRARTSDGSLVSLRSPQFHRYWLEFRRVLNEWWRKKRFQDDIMSELIRLAKARLDEHNVAKAGKRGKRYSSCAVVGNSGILLMKDYGDLIDGHEFVIRLNNANISSFERHVGSKTSVSFVNSNILHLCARRETCSCHPYGANVPIIMYICQAVHFLDYTLCNTTHKSPLIVTDPRFDVLCARIVKYYSMKRFVDEIRKPVEEWSSAHDGSNFHYSSGIQAVMLAVGICDQVSLFGFGKSDSAKHHYHTNQKAELKLHDYEAEYELYHDLVHRPRAIPFISNTFNFPPVTKHQ
uniref:Uncharacterized protein n=1 Tax=Kalanchoe fedtschenkoi TaxID=63787 RepID=A0A7N0TL49_KALFE